MDIRVCCLVRLAVYKVTKVDGDVYVPYWYLVRVVKDTGFLDSQKAMPRTMSKFGLAAVEMGWN